MKTLILILAACTFGYGQSPVEIVELTGTVTAIKYGPAFALGIFELKIEDANLRYDEIAQPVSNPHALGKERYKDSVSARGMGLGLWICRQIVDLHAASFAIKLEGVRFKVTVAFP